MAAVPPSPISKKSAPPALPAAVETGLSLVDELLNALDADLVAGEATAYERHCVELQKSLLDLQTALTSSAVKGKIVSERLRILGKRLAQQRDNMARRSVLVDKQLEIMLPGLAGATYSRTASAYGSGQRASGKLTSIKA